MQPTFNNHKRGAGDIVFLERTSSWFPEWVTESKILPMAMKTVLLDKTMKLERGNVIKTICLILKYK